LQFLVAPERRNFANIFLRNHGSLAFFMEKNIHHRHPYGSLVVKKNKSQEESKEKVGWFYNDVYFSSQFQLYSYLFPGYKRKMNLQDMPPELRLSLHKEIQEYFNLAHVGEIFTGCRIKYDMYPQAIPTLIEMMNTKLGEQRKVTMDYDFDHLRYRSDSWIHHHADGVKELNIKLSNDGFIYINEYTLKTKAINKSARGYDGWAVLDTPDQSEFRPLIDFARVWFQTHALKFVIHYNFIESRIDFHVYNNAEKSSLIITFEPGYPESIVKEDYWVELP